MKAAATLIALLALLPATAYAEGADENDVAFLGAYEAPEDAPKVTQERTTARGADSLLSYARELMKKGMPEAALHFLEAALTYEPHRAEIHFDLAEAYKALGRTEAASLAFERYLSLAGAGGRTVAAQDRADSLNGG